jgi:hypothetical protein
MRSSDEPSPSLAQIQQRFADALLDAAREPALNEVVVTPAARGERAVDAVDAANAVDAVDAANATHHAHASLCERIGLYRGNLRAHARNALANAYPVLLSLTGDAWFDALARAYERAHPSQSGDLNAFGDGLPSFVERHETDPRRRHFGDLARLEWAVHRAHYAADAVPFTPAQWQAFGEARLLDARLAVHPACTTLALRHPVVAIWLARQQHDQAGPTGLDAPSYALVVRPRWRAFVIEQSAAAHAACVALRRGATLNDALDAAFDLDGAFDFAGQWQQWIANGAITGAFAQ